MTSHHHKSSEVLGRIARSIKRLRVEREWTQQKLADRCGLTRSYISKVEWGKANVSLSTVEAIVKGLNCETREIFRKEDVITKWNKVVRFYKYCSRLFRTYRRKHKLTIEQLAKKMAMAVEWVRDIEVCIRDISLLDVVVIGKFFKIEAGRLLKDGGL